MKTSTGDDGSFATYKQFPSRHLRLFVIVRMDNMFLTKTTRWNALVIHVVFSGHILLLAQNKVLSLRAMHIPGQLGVRARLRPENGGCILIPLVGFGKTAQFPFGSSLPTLGINTLAHAWLMAHLYAFPPVILVLPVLMKVREVRLLLVVPFWPFCI